MRFLTIALLFAVSVARAEHPGHKLIACDRNKVAIFDSAGKIIWEMPNKATAHDVQPLPNGNVLLHTGTATVSEVTPDKKTVWTYTATPKPGSKEKVEVHGFQRLPDGLTLVSETGNRRLVEVDAAGKIVKEVPLTVEKPNSHRDTRLARKLPNGNYLVCHEGDGVVREYDRDGKVFWSYKLDLANRPRTPGHGPEGHGTEVFGAIRLPNGNTVIAGGNNNRVIEVNHNGETVWSVGHDELPGIRLAWVTTLHALPNGNLVIGNTHGTPSNPQLIEVTRDKKVVWTFKNYTDMGDGLCAAAILDVPGVIR